MVRLQTEKGVRAFVSRETVERVAPYQLSSPGSIVYFLTVSRAFTKDDAPDQPLLVLPRAPLPEGVPSYVTARGPDGAR